MHTNKQTILVSLMAVFSIASAPAFGATGDKAKAQGMIISRTGETLIVSDQGNECHCGPHRRHRNKGR